jgi:hypothetical protein
LASFSQDNTYDISQIFTVTPGAADASGDQVVAAVVRVPQDDSYQVAGATLDPIRYYDLSVYGDPNFLGGFPDATGKIQVLRLRRAWIWRTELSAQLIFLICSKIISTTRI